MGWGHGGKKADENTRSNKASRMQLDRGGEEEESFYSWRLVSSRKKRYLQHIKCIGPTNKRASLNMSLSMPNFLNAESFCHFAFRFGIPVSHSIHTLVNQPNLIFFFFFFFFNAKFHDSTWDA